MTDVAVETIELLLASMRNEVGDDGLRHAFFFGKPGAPHWNRGMGVEIFYSESGLTLAALHLRRLGPPYLRSVPVGTVRSLLTNFVQENYWPIGEDTFLARHGSEPFSTLVSQKTKTALADALRASQIFQPQQHPFLFPLVPINVDANFTSPVFFLHGPSSLLTEFASDAHQWITPSTFPPLTETSAPPEIPQSWLGVRAAVEAEAVKIKAAVLGAAALTLTERYRYMFSGRAMFGGVCRITNGSGGFHFGDPHTPALMEDIRVRDCDRGWLQILATKLVSIDPVDRRQIRALEYFYRAWPLPSHERYPLHCIALDALFGEKNRSTPLIKEGAKSAIGPHLDTDRVGKLLEIRGAVIHGRAPDVFDAAEYAEYFESYETDPIWDVAALTAAVLRQVVFHGAILDQDEPHQEIIAEARAKGRIPAKRRARGILDAP
jgi:hypothetical protein